MILDTMPGVIETSSEEISMIKGGKVKNLDPKTKCPIENVIPGWSDTVLPLKQDAAFWHFMWREADRPDQGQLRDIMVRTRNQYHYLVRKVKKLAGQIRATKLLEACETSSLDLLKERRKTSWG